MGPHSDVRPSARDLRAGGCAHDVRPSAQAWGPKAPMKGMYMCDFRPSAWPWDACAEDCARDVRPSAQPQCAHAGKVYA